ncbi:tRNA lysidine(34) synthetase TilS [uncultured Ruminococcus sp.]|uniref:tRNA lysidine(34) synthetase TilS n=1 Tax=uncultured Ruminococcus sp. TaxID=165186 RepID=UPI000ED45782|nr:tRNA lysidine(34) synthetase TilS [uncultured Ruminococcus sp.]HCJ42270.1 tRNA lysidine(34) synthetase TilS [Ruminococcus sp.]
MKSELAAKVERTIRKFHMAVKGERLLVGLSGGADSAALLLCLNELGYDVSACHVNHCIRGEEADRDQHFCERLCEGLGIGITVRRVDVPAYCRANPVSEEEGARLLRYNALQEISADKICTAHNLDDCLETTLFNLARGSGLKGIASIPPVRGNIIRPLIECSREEIEAYLAERGQNFVTDSTNLLDEYSRNKLRHKVVPVLKEINPVLMETFAKTLGYIRQDSAYMEKLADKAFEDCIIGDGFSRTAVRKLDYPIRRRVIMRILAKNEIEISQDKIELIEQLIIEGGKASVKANSFAYTKSDVLYIYSEKDMPDQSADEIGIVPDTVIDWQNRRVCFKIIEIDGKFENVNKKFANSCLDYDKIKGVIVLRKRRAGDKLRLVGRDFNSDVRVLMKQNFPAHKRDSAVILADDDGVVLAEGSGAADRVKIDSNTRHVLVFEDS